MNPPINVINLDSVPNRFRFTWTAILPPIQAAAEAQFLEKTKDYDGGAVEFRLGMWLATYSRSPDDS